MEQNQNMKKIDEACLSLLRLNTLLRPAFVFEHELSRELKKLKDPKEGFSKAYDTVDKMYGLNGLYDMADEYGYRMAIAETATKLVYHFGIWTDNIGKLKGITQCNDEPFSDSGIDLIELESELKYFMELFTLIYKNNKGEK